MWKDIKRELLSNKVALISLIMLAIIMIAVLLAPLSPYDPYKIDVSQKLQGISAKHWFGTDDYGRDYSHVPYMEEEFHCWLASVLC